MNDEAQPVCKKVASHFSSEVGGPSRRLCSAQNIRMRGFSLVDWVQDCPMSEASSESDATSRLVASEVSPLLGGRRNVLRRTLRLRWLLVVPGKLIGL